VKRLSNEPHAPSTEGGDADEASAESKESEESEWPPSEMERLRDGIKAALSCLAPYKAHWPHVRIACRDVVMMLMMSLPSSGDYVAG